MNDFPSPPEAPLHCAACIGDLAQLNRLLVEVDPNLRDDRNRTPLMYACSPEIVEVLIAAGADISSIDDYGKDALQIILEETSSAIESLQCLETAQALITAGAELEQHNPFGQTRLYSAAFAHADRAVALLLSLGANPWADRDDHYTPLHAICWQGEAESAAIQQATDRIIGLLVQAGVDVNARDIRGNAPLHEAALGDRGNPTAIRALLKYGADPDLPNGTGETPLMIAAGMGELECVQVLLEAGANLRCTNRTGKTAIDYAQGNYQAWQQINQSPLEVRGKFDQDLRKVLRRHHLALQRAQRCLQLLQSLAEP